jgi:flagellar biosynthesis/type III secretory pathway chaperone
LADILPKMDAAQRARVSELKKSLQESASVLKNRERVNKDLLKSALEHAEGFLQTIRETLGGGATTYAYDGKRKTDGKSFIDRTI